MYLFTFHHYSQPTSVYQKNPKLPNFEMHDFLKTGLFVCDSAYVHIQISHHGLIYPQVSHFCRHLSKRILDVHVRLQEQKDDGTICTIAGESREGEWQREGETSTCLMVIGDIIYTNNEAEDDNIFRMTSVFVKAVLTQRNGTLNHPHTPDVYAQWHAQTHLNTHRRTKTFHFTFSSPIKYATTRGGEGTRVTL